MRIAYVRPSVDTVGGPAATSGSRRQPAGAGASGWFVELGAGGVEQLPLVRAAGDGRVRVPDPVHEHREARDATAQAGRRVGRIRGHADGDPAVAATMPFVAWPILNVRAVSVAGSMRSTVPAAPVVAQRAPSP